MILRTSGLGIEPDGAEEGETGKVSFTIVGHLREMISSGHTHQRYQIHPIQVMLNL